MTTRIHWTKIKLYDAAGTGITSEWNTAKACALERDGERAASSEEITAEHLRALTEIRADDSCANWFTNVDLSELGPHKDDIDWSDFAGSSEDHA